MNLSRRFKSKRGKVKTLAHNQAQLLKLGSTNTYTGPFVLVIYWLAPILVVLGAIVGHILLFPTKKQYSRHKYPCSDSRAGVWLCSTW
jgi:hypothetical protein